MLVEKNPWRHRVTVGQDGILRPVGNRPAAAEQLRSKSADAIGAQDAILPHKKIEFAGRTRAYLSCEWWQLQREMRGKRP